MTSATKARPRRRTTTPKDSETANDEREARLKEAHDTMARQVERLRTSEDWIAWLDLATKFHNYSFMNVLLMHAQAIEREMAPLTHVAGFKRWLELNRYVRKGESGLKVFAPMTRNYREGEEGYDPTRPNRTKLIGFRLTSVFDYQQTDGEPLPEAPSFTYPEGEIPAGLLERLTMFATTIGFTVEYGRTGTANGYTDPESKRIVLSESKLTTDARKARTLAHEIGHAVLHTEGDFDYRTHRGVAETEAESVAYLVGTYLGIDMKDYSFHYIAGWTPDLETVTNVGQRVMKTANMIIEAVEGVEVDQ